MSNLKQQFTALDKNKDGKLSFEEIAEVICQHLTVDKSAIVMNILRDKIDSNRSGMIDYSEFISFTVQHEKLLTRENLKKAFEKIDLDNNGTLSVDELKKAFEAASEGEEDDKRQKFWEQFVGEMDANNDKVIQLEEFISFMEKVTIDSLVEHDAINDDE